VLWARPTEREIKRRERERERERETIRRGGEGKRGRRVGACTQSRKTERETGDVNVMVDREMVLRETTSYTLAHKHTQIYLNTHTHTVIHKHTWIEG